MTRAIFLSYASQDADAARRLCDALRSLGLEVSFDQSELRGCDAWDASIRKQIKECALFIPLISANTNARSEGYFRLEWKLAVDGSHLMAEDTTFFEPVILDACEEASARVPDAFRARQWSRVADDNAVNAFAARIAKIIDGGALSSKNAPNAAPLLSNNVQISSPDGAKRTPGSVSNEPPTRRKTALVAATVIAIIGVGIYFTTQNKSATAPTSSTSINASNPATINPLSVMVMPFANQTGDAQKAYIADALTSSITGDLSRIRDATIIPAVTAFSLADKKLTIPQLGKEAAVRFVLTGNVTGNNEKLRISAALSDTQTGAQLWTENFDDAATDLFALQDQVTTRIGNTIGSQMVIAAARESEKRANKPEVADLLMRAAAINLNQQSLKNHQTIETLYRQVLALDPNNLRAKVGLAISLSLQAGNFADELKLDRAASVALAKQAADLAQEVQRVDQTNPDVYNPQVINASIIGELERAVQLAKRRVDLEPKSLGAYATLGRALIFMGDMPGARAALGNALQFASPARRPSEIYVNLSRVAFAEDRSD